ncbi:thiol-disulfide oxidoreductase DCC family protein [Brevibacillus daliensis]|uniref:thiol-disulfide oxidoreductase DCC family protein n=1 Tax=Brevibacillus daliensis TaxID=2892995 RepID=UPI001E58FF81|nr:DUF393 domain-containing protein [Brevibacillus daliensis]
MKSAIVYYDKECNMCRFIRKWLIRLARPAYKKNLVWRHYVDAPACDIHDRSCGESLKVELPSTEILQAFYAVRMLLRFTWFFWLVPLLYIPGMSYVGERVYRYVAKNRYSWFGRSEEKG